MEKVEKWNKNLCSVAAICFFFALTKTIYGINYSLSYRWKYDKNTSILFTKQSDWWKNSSLRWVALHLARNRENEEMKIANRISSASAIQFTKHVNRKNHKHFGKLLKNKSTSLEIRRRSSVNWGVEEASEKRKMLNLVNYQQRSPQKQSMKAEAKIEEEEKSLMNY